MGTSKNNTTPASDDALKLAAQLIKDGKAKSIAVLCGAGISTSAGIPDFRSPGTGLYDNLAALDLPFPEAVFTLDYFQVRPEPFWTLAKDLYPGKYMPTPTHYFLSLLHERGLLQRVWTQNIDTLETAAGVPVDKVLEAHGSFATASCLLCKRPASTEHVFRSGVREGNVVRCSRDGCKGLVKPSIVFFGEALPEDFWIHKRELFDCDLLLVMGTSLQVEPFASLVHVVDSSTPRVLINREAVGPFARRGGAFWKKGSGKADRDHVFLGDADAAVSTLVRELGWEDELEERVREGRKTLEKTWRAQERMWRTDGAGEEVEESEEDEGKEEAEKEEEEEAAAAAPKAEAKAAVPAAPSESADKLAPAPAATVADEGEDEDVSALAAGVAKVDIKEKAKV